MGRPRKIKESDNNIDDLINKMKDSHPEHSELVDKIVDTVNKKVDSDIITSKVGDYYIDDNNNIWNSELNLIGIQDINKMHFYVDIKKITNKILNSK
jgi:hypothetical protein